MSKQRPKENICMTDLFLSDIPQNIAKTKVAYFSVPLPCATQFEDSA
jgi:hypothetical protein